MNHPHRVAGKVLISWPEFRPDGLSAHRIVGDLNPIDYRQSSVPTTIHAVIKLFLSNTDRAEGYRFRRTTSNRSRPSRTTHAARHESPAWVSGELQCCNLLPARTGHR